MLKFIQKWLHNNFFLKYGFGWLSQSTSSDCVDYIGIFFDISEYFWQMTVCVYNFIL
jgi:hypothetical protein